MLKRMKQHNFFSAKFKVQIVLELLTGIKSNAELCSQHHIQEQELLYWKREFLERAHQVFELPSSPTLEQLTDDHSASFSFASDALNERESDIVGYIVSGMDNRNIAENMCISINTVRWYIKGIYSKFDVHSRSELIVKVQKYMKQGHGIEPLE